MTYRTQYRVHYEKVVGDYRAARRSGLLPSRGAAEHLARALRENAEIDAATVEVKEEVSK